ncbi:MAG: methyltransferase domain-containing protein [Alphaproteobacteria bacterium]|nr:methyltransferase domain-containing protein [Alphaproteobacteria bacterium]
MKNAPGPSSPRAVALRLLQAVLGRRAPMDQAIENDPALHALAPRDRALVRLLLATVLRHLGQLDAAIGACLDKPLPRNAETVRNALRIGAAQVLFLKTPAHAAVSTAVALIPPRFGRMKGLANAVLRRLTREGEALIAAQDGPRLNTPDWLWRRWAAFHGEDACPRIAAAHMVEPPLDLSVRNDPDGWAERLGGTVLPTGSVRLRESGNIADLSGYSEGAWWVQDAAAAMPVKMLGDLAGKTVFDLCAAPGGKTAQLAALGARVTAVDRSAARLKRLKENLDRLGIAAECIAADAAAWEPAAPADVVVLDAPCSATGTIRRHPDIPYGKSADDIARLAQTQARLLAAAAGMVAPGGLLLYCVCSLEAEEGPDRIAPFLAANPSFRPEPPRPFPGCESFLTREGYLRTLPCHWPERGGLDGFFAALFRKAD